MTLRTRTNYKARASGTRTRFGSPVTSALTYELHETCQDHVVPGDNMPFVVNREELSGGIIDSDYNGGFFAPYFSNYSADALTNGQLAPIVSFPGEKPDAEYASSAVARTNPSRPYVDVPVSILELGDVTQILRSSGNTLIKQLAGNNLKYQFGIKPLVDDLYKLTSFHEHVSKRVNEMKKLMGPRGLRRTVTLDHLEVSDSPQIWWQTADCWMVSPAPRKAERIVRGHCRWVPDVDFKTMPERELVALAKKAVLGLTVDFSTLWEAMPWSWLIDWGYNVGAFLKAQRNIIPATCTSVMLVKHTRTEYSWDEVRDSQHKMSAGRKAFETKARYTVPAAPAAHFPFLSGNQMGILASLAVTRR